MDRAWVLSLPQPRVITYGMERIPVDSIKLVGWNELKNAFYPLTDNPTFNDEIANTYSKITDSFRKQRISISPRVDRAIKNYWAVASQIMKKDDTGTTPTYVALDYAVSQRILPKITGNGEDYEKWLFGLKELFKSSQLNASAKIIEGIIERGNDSMNYFQFF